MEWFKIYQTFILLWMIYYCKIHADSNCPGVCQCTFQPPSLSIECSEDPGEEMMNSYLHDKTVVIQSLSVRAHLSAIPTGMCSLTQLTNLDLSNNNISRLEPDCLTSMKDLQTFNMVGNKLVRLEEHTFSGLVSLTSVTLYNNNINSIHPKTFVPLAKAKHLQSINLDSNNLTSIDTWVIQRFSAGKHLVISLEKNPLGKTTNELGLALSCIAKAPNHEISMKHNVFQYMNDIFQGWGLKTPLHMICLFKDNAIIDIREGHFICDCRDYHIYDAIKRFQSAKSVTLTQLTCYEPKEYRNTAIFGHNLEDFICNVTNDCPLGCRCVVKPRSATITVICNSGNLTELPHVIPAQPKIPDIDKWVKFQPANIQFSYALNFKGNKISNVSDSKYYMKNVSYMDLRENGVSDVSVVFLDSVRGKTETLLLSSNILKYFPKNATNIDFLRLKSLSLNDNKWICDCHTLWFKHWLRNMTGQILNAQSILCHYPQRLYGSSIVKLSDSEFICGDKFQLGIRHIVYFTMGTLAGCALFCLTPIVHTYRKYKGIKRLRNKPYGTENDIDDVSKTWDVFVSYAGQDSQWVEAIVQTLEEKQYRVCLHKRDFRPGGLILRNIAEAIESSLRVVVFLTVPYLESTFCMHEFDLAYSNDVQTTVRRLVVIRTPEVTPELLTTHNNIKTYFKTFTYLEYGTDPCSFWKQLLKALPSEPMGPTEYVYTDSDVSSLLSISMEYEHANLIIQA